MAEAQIKQEQAKMRHVGRTVLLLMIIHSSLISQATAEEQSILNGADVLGAATIWYDPNASIGPSFSAMENTCDFVGLQEF